MPIIQMGDEGLRKHKGNMSRAVLPESPEITNQLQLEIKHGLLAEAQSAKRTWTRDSLGWVKLRGNVYSLGSTSLAI